MEKQLVPKLRFPEFEKVWKKENLQKLCRKTISYGIVQTGGNIEKGVPCVRVVDLTGVNLDAENMIKTSEEISNSYKKTILEENEVMLALRGDIGLVKLVEKSLVGANITRGVARLSADEDLINPFFLNWVIQSNKTLKQINKQVNGSALKEIPLGGLRKVSIFLSGSLIEQQKIASFLTDVDNKITKLTKKKELLEQYKKGVMQKIFSQKLRFKDDNGNAFPKWEIKKLGNVFSSFKGKGIPKGDVITDGNYKCVLYGELYTTYNEVINKVVSSTNSEDGLRSKKGDLLIPSSTTTTGIDLANVTALNFENILLGGDIIVMRGKKEINNVFYAYYLSNFKKHQIASRAQGITIVHIYFNSIKDLEIDVPVVEEQTKIANFLSDIDVKIEALNTKIEHSKSFKKGLLQQMFI